MDMQELGQAMRAARKQRKLTQRQLSEQLGMSRATISAIENGTVNEVGIRKVLAICSLLGLEMLIQSHQPRRPTLHTLVTEAAQRKRRNT